MTDLALTHREFTKLFVVPAMGFVAVAIFVTLYYFFEIRKRGR